MAEVSSRELAKKDIKSLLIKQSVPASVGILFATVNILIDAIFVGQWIGSLAIAALSVVMPLSFFIASLGLAIGSGGGSVLSRALGAGNREKALNTFAHQIMMTFGLSSIFVVAGFSSGCAGCAAHLVHHKLFVRFGFIGFAYMALRDTVVREYQLVIVKTFKPFF